jgi:plasmid stabilization system protein ParE
MLSGYKIYWTDEALTNLESIITYLKENWSDKEVSGFIKKLNKRLELISINPGLFAKTNIKKDVRRSVLTKHTVIYYLFEDELIKILSLFDPRQNPDKLRL